MKIALTQLILLPCLGLLSLGLFSGCGSSDAGANAGTANATACAQSDLIAQCPPNTMADLSSNASSVCSMSGSIDVSQDGQTTGGNAGAAVTTACAGSGSCRVVCRLLVECTHGVARVSETEGIVCADRPEGCGNGTCDPGERPDWCPGDCGVVCAADETQCDGDKIQECDERGQWEEPRACPSGTRCAELADGARCLQPTCGNGLVDGDDDCEPQSSNDPNCDPNCRFPACGNGHVGLDENGMPEECDDGNEENTDACTNACRNASCGDGYEFEGVEECDDGNRVDTDTCTNDCTTPYCGDGVVQATEECDDGNESDEDACRDDCTRNVCGDGVINPAIEACDEGMNNTDTGACLQSCQVASCGDGFLREDILSPGLDGFEYCDDDNENEFDGCNSSCEQTEVEPNDDFGDVANTILFDRIVGVMEGQGARSPGVDTYEFQLNCGVQSGQDCPPSGDVTWNFTLTTPQDLCAAVPIGGRPDCNVRNFEVAAACNGVCAELVELTFERREGAAIDERVAATTIRWSYVGDREGTWSFQLISNRLTAFDYTLTVTAE